MTKCKGCGAEIVWIKTAAGKSMPCDANAVAYWADPLGKHTVITPNGEIVRCDLECDPNKTTSMGYVPHWATCPAAKNFKRKGK